MRVDEVATYVSQDGNWYELDAGGTIAVDTAANIIDKTATINTSRKFVNKRVWDSTNNRELRANGTTDVAVWHVVDGSATITPV